MNNSMAQGPPKRGRSIQVIMTSILMLGLLSFGYVWLVFEIIGL